VSEAPRDTTATPKRWSAHGAKRAAAAERRDARLDREAADAELER
jgi:hypothetical protein